MAEEKCQRLSSSDTRRLLEDYEHYRFGRVLSGQDFAKQAGVSESVIKDLFAQKQISNSDLDRIAKSIDVSPELLSEVAGYREMPERMLQTLARFFKAVEAYRQGQKKARAA